MANDGWFKCDKCVEMKKVLVADDVKTLSESSSCGGTYRKV